MLVLGLSLQGGHRRRPRVAVVRDHRAACAQRGAEVAYCDPYIPVAKAGREHDIGLASVPCTADEFARHDVLLVSTAHSEFKHAALYARAKLVVDTRNLMAPLGLGAPGAPGPEVERA